MLISQFIIARILNTFSPNTNPPQELPSLYEFVFGKDYARLKTKWENHWLPLGLGVCLKGTRATAISVVGLSFLGLLDFGLSSTIGC